jgi:hypothetical protein
LEKAGLYARSLEQYDEAIKARARDTEPLKKYTIRFEKSRLLLTVDPDNEEGLKEFTGAVDEGYSDIKAIETLVLDERINKYHRDEIEKILNNLKVKLDDAEDDENGEDETETSA